MFHDIFEEKILILIFLNFLIFLVRGSKNL